MNISVLGPPGSGKGTQAKLVAAHFGLKHFSLGETLRAEIDKDSDLGRKTATYVQEGKLVPEPLVLELFKSFSIQNRDGGLVLDGYPRTVGQAKALDEILSLSCVILFEVIEEEVLTRLSSRVIDLNGVPYNLKSNPPPKGVKYKRRKDDRPEVVQARFREYVQEVEPIAQHYNQRGILVTLDAEGTIGKILDGFLQKLAVIEKSNSQ